MRTVCWVGIALLLFAESAAADTIILKNGLAISGMLVDREQIRSHELLPPQIAVVDSAGERQEIALADIDRVIIEDPDGVRIVGARAQPKSSIGRTGISRGTVLIGSGFVVGLVGAAVPMGGARPVRISGGRTRYVTSYGEGNYIVVAVGLAMVVTGSIMNMSNATDFASAPLTVQPGSAPLSGTPGIVCCLRF